MPGISSVRPSASAAEDALNAIGNDDDSVHGFLSVEDGDDAVDGKADGEEEEDSSASHSSWTPPSDLADIWESLVGIAPSDSWEESKRLGPTISAISLRWSTLDSRFRPLRKDPCLHAQFEKLSKENKSFMDFAFSSMAASTAAAHAVSHAAAYMEEFVRNLSSVLPDPVWASFCENAEKAVTADAILPLRDASRGLAHNFGRAVSFVRSGVIRHSDAAIQPVLRSSPPSSGFFFGDPAAQVSSSLNLAVMSSLIQRQRAPASRGGYFRRPATSSRGASSSTSTAASPSSASASKGKGAGRSFKGRGGGRK